MFGREGKGDTLPGVDAQGSMNGVSSVDAHDLATNLATNLTNYGGNRLVVGRGLTFNGDIEACTHLLIGGSVTSDVKACDRLEINAGGSFHGNAMVNDADIGGQFEGELTVLGHLHLRADGRISGRITYGTLSVESGGRLLGNTDSSAEGPRPQLRPVVVPLRPVAHTAGRDSRH